MGHPRHRRGVVLGDFFRQLGCARLAGVSRQRAGRPGVLAAIEANTAGEITSAWWAVCRINGRRIRHWSLRARARRLRRARDATGLLLDDTTRVRAVAQSLLTFRVLNKRLVSPVWFGLRGRESPRAVSRKAAAACDSSPFGRASATAADIAPPKSYCHKLLPFNIGNRAACGSSADAHLFSTARLMPSRLGSAI